MASRPRGERARRRPDRSLQSGHPFFHQWNSCHAALPQRKAKAIQVGKDHGTVIGGRRRASSAACNASANTFYAGPANLAAQDKGHCAIVREASRAIRDVRKIRYASLSGQARP